MMIKLLPNFSRFTLFSRLKISSLNTFNVSIGSRPFPKLWFDNHSGCLESTQPPLKNWLRVGLLHGNGGVVFRVILFDGVGGVRIAQDCMFRSLMSRDSGALVETEPHS